MTQNDTEVPVAPKKYKGKLVLNTNVGKKMHLIAKYYTFFGRLEGIYSDAYDTLVNTIVQRRKDDMMSTVFVEGPPGCGKSAMCLNLCLDIAKKLKVGFNLSEDYIYGANDLWAKFENPHANPINFIDEGSVTLASNNAMQKSDKNIVVLFDTMRSKGWINIIASPTIMRFNGAIRRDHVDFKIRCTPKTKPLIPGYGRGFFECRRAVRHEFSKDEPQWPMMYAGVFADYPPLLKDEYLQIKARRQDMLMESYIKRARFDDAKIEKQMEKVMTKEELEGEW